jgi:hypothetical protein
MTCQGTDLQISPICRFQSRSLLLRMAVEAGRQRFLGRLLHQALSLIRMQREIDGFWPLSGPSTVAPRIDQVGIGELPFTTCIVRKCITYTSSPAMFASRSANVCFRQRS